MFELKYCAYDIVLHFHLTYYPLLVTILWNELCFLKFKKWFKQYNNWYDGEVVELVKIKNYQFLFRRCQYSEDGSVEDYTITEMKKCCFKPR